MEIKRVGSQASGKGPSGWFTGIVRFDPLFQAPDPALLQGAGVTFEPGARTAWHTHPLGQALRVTSGCGWVQRWGGPAVVNATESEQKFNLTVTGARVAGPLTLWRMTGASLDASNRLGEPPQVTVKEISMLRQRPCRPFHGRLWRPSDWHATSQRVWHPLRHDQAPQGPRQLRHQKQL